jgi:ABC-type Mn2+/Zn2+ transport system permease subunit
MNTLIEILSPDFLLRQALIGSVLVGLVCPLVGVYFVLRRMIFLGVALPQLSAAGIAFSFFLYRMLMGSYEHFELTERSLAMIGSFSFTLIGLLVLAALEHHKETIEARIGITYAAAAAATILFVAADPTADAHMVSLLRGDILATTGTSLLVLGGVFSVVVAMLLIFRKEFLLVSFDRDLATVFGKRVRLWDSLLYLLIGVTISLGVMTAGPLVTFGFLVVPPLAARLITRRMLTFSLVASGFGAVAAFMGFYCAYRFDFPLGPCQVAVASMGLVVVATVDAVRRTIGSRIAHEASFHASSVLPASELRVSSTLVGKEHVEQAYNDRRK